MGGDQKVDYRGRVYNLDRSKNFRVNLVGPNASSRCHGSLLPLFGCKLYFRRRTPRRRNGADMLENTEHMKLNMHCVLVE
jgi:hypothetical protein